MEHNSGSCRGLTIIATALFFLLPRIAVAALGPEDHKSVVRAVSRVFDVYRKSGVDGLTSEVAACPDAALRPRIATSPIYCLALDLGAMRLVEGIEESNRWPSSPYFKLDKVMGRAGALLQETLPPTDAQENALRPVMIAIWCATNQETQLQFLTEVKKRAASR